MQPHEERVFAEHTDLSSKIRNLERFFASSTYADLSDADQMLLQCQINFMRGYRDVLSHRIYRLSKSEG